MILSIVVLAVFIIFQPLQPRRQIYKEVCENVNTMPSAMGRRKRSCKMGLDANSNDKGQTDNAMMTDAVIGGPPTTWTPHDLTEGRLQ